MIERHDPPNEQPGENQLSYPVPNPDDLVVIEFVPQKPQHYKPLEPDTPHPENARNSLDLRLVWQGPTSSDPNRMVRVYSGPRTCQDVYNFALEYSGESNAGPIFIRSYLERREAYVALAKGSPLTGVVNIRLTNGGTGYTTATATIVGGGGSGATAVVKILDGVIVAIRITNEGSGYSSNPTVEITGDGEDAAATAAIQPSGAVLVKEEVKKITDEIPEMFRGWNEAMLGGLFVRVLRIYETLPGPWIPSARWDDNLGAIRVRKRSVLTGYAIELNFTDGTRNYTWRPNNNRYVLAGSEPTDPTQWFIDIIREDYGINATATFYEIVDEVQVGHWKFERINGVWTLTVDNPEGSTSVPPVIAQGFEFFNATQVASSTATTKNTFEAREGSSVVSIETSEAWGDEPYDLEFSVEIPDLVPPEYRDLLPTRTSGQTEVGRPAPPELGTGEHARSSREVNKHWRHETVTGRDLTRLPVSRVDYDLDGINAGGSEFGGVFSNTRTLALGPQSVQEGFEITKSSVKELGNGLSLRETKRLSGALPARLLLTYPGSGFATAPAVVFGAGDLGSGAAGTAHLSSAPVIPPDGEPGGTFPLNFASFGDNKGIFYFIGARYNGGVWRNPATAGNVQIVGQPSVPSAQVAKLVDRSAAAQIIVIPTNTGSHQIVIDIGVGKKLKANRITIRQADPASSGTIMRNLRVEAANDFVTITTLGADVPIPQGAGEWSQGLLDDSVGYRYFRVFGTDDSIPGVFPRIWPALVLGEIELYGELDIVPGVVRQYSFDGDANGVFYDLGARGNGGVWRNPHTNGDIECAADDLTLGTLDQLVDREPSNIGQGAGTGKAFYFDLLEGRSLICNKMSFRQRTSSIATPCSVQLQGTNDPTFVTSDWHALANFVTPSAADSWKTIDVPGNVSYRRFRLISATGNFRIGEVELYGALTFPPAVVPDPSFSIESVSVENAGSGYAVPPAVLFEGGGGTGAAGTAVLNDDGGVASVLMTNHGSGYATVPTVSFLSSGLVGSGAAATAIIDGQVQEVVVDAGGDDYEVPPDVVFAGGGGSGAAADAVLAFLLQSIAVTNPGSGDYSFPPTVLIDPADASAHSVLSYRLASIGLDNGGSGYSSPPTVVIDAPTGVDGVQATAHAVMGTGGPTTETLSYVSDGDDNGTLYRLGTNFGAVAWTNPHTAGRCVVTRSSTGNGGEQDIVDRTTEDTYTDNIANSWIAIDLGLDRELVVSDYTLQNRAFSDRAIRNWKLQGSNDAASNSISDLAAATWVDIDVRVGDTTMSPVLNDFATYAVSGTPAAYRWLRILQTGFNSSGSDNYLTVAEIELYGDFSYISSSGSDVVVDIVIDDPGYGYLSTPGVSFTGDGTGAAATAELETTGFVDSVVIDSSSLFETPPDVTFDGDGTGATGTANLATGGSVIRVDVTAPGTNYQSAPTVSFDPVGADPGTGAAATSFIEGPVTGFTVTNGGSNYDVAPNVDIPGGASATANVSGGAVISLTLTNPGSGYSVPPAVAFSALGGPEGVATLGFGVNNINVTNGGSGYAVEPPVHIEGNGRSASARAILGRGLAVIEVVAGGDNYASSITVGIQGPGGSNFGATATAQRSFGIQSATVGAGGSGYTSDPEITAPAPAGGIDAIFQAIRGLRIREVVMTNPGAEYSTPPTVGFADPFPGPGDTAVGTAVLGFAVDTIAMDDMGLAYLSAPLVEIRPKPSGGGGATAIAELLGRTLDSIFVDNGGSGYTSPPTVIVGDGSNGAAHAVLTGDVITSIVVDDPGIGFLSAPTILILNDGGGSGAHAVGILSASQNMRIVITNPGAGFEEAPDVIITGGGGSGAEATATLKTTGGVKRVELSDQGSDYTTDTPVAFTGGGGTGAAGTAVRDLASAGPIALIAVLQAGSGYIATTINCVITGGGGTGATAVAVKKTLGSIKSITLTNAGANLEAPPVVSIGQAFGGVGSGAVLRAVLLPTGKVKRIVMTSAGEGYTAAPAITFPANDGTGATATSFLKSTGSIETLTLTVPGGPFSVAPLVSFLPTGDAPLATALYLLAQVWPTLVDEITDPTDKLIVQVTKDIKPYGTPLPAGYSEMQALNRYRSIQMVSKIDLSRLPPVETYLTTQHVGLPNQLLAVTPVWSTRIAQSTSINQNHSDGNASAAAEISGSILVLKTGGFRGAAVARVQRVHFNGIPPDASIPLPTIIRPSTGTAFIKGGANSVSRAGSPNGPILNFFGQPAQIGDLMGYNPVDGLPYYYAGGLGLVGPNITTSSSSSISSNLQIADISDVLTAGINLATINGVVQESGSGDPGALDVHAEVEGTFGVSMPASCPASLQPGSSILQEVGVEKRRFNLYVRTIVYVIVPGNCDPVGGPT